VMDRMERLFMAVQANAARRRRCAQWIVLIQHILQLYGYKQATGRLGGTRRTHPSRLRVIHSTRAYHWPFLGPMDQIGWGPARC
jgi:hypothetical protein